MTREEAIEKLYSKMDGSVDDSYEWVEAIRMAIEALSEPKTGEWIPCSEGLPDIDTPVIICTADGSITDGYRWNEKDWFLAWGEYNGWHEGNDGGRIVAWMPLPTMEKLKLSWRVQIPPCGFYF